MTRSSCQTSLHCSEQRDDVAGQCVLGLNLYKLQASVQLPANSTQQAPAFHEPRLSLTPVTAVGSLVLPLSSLHTLPESLHLSHLSISYSFIVVALDTIVFDTVYLFFASKQLYMRTFMVMNRSGSRFLGSEAP